MIICVCHNVSEGGIQKAVDSGLSSMKELRTELQIGTCCGRCHPTAKNVLKECLQKKVCQTSMHVMSFHPNMTTA